MTARKPEAKRISVVKVQVAMFPKGAPALIYDEGGEHVQQRKLDDAEERQMHGKMKVFFNAWWSDATGWVLLSVANARRW
jgi:hypothetical protein